MKRAGLPLSVGQASLAVRLSIAAVFTVVALLCIGGGMAMSAIVPARIVAVLLVMPLGLSGAVAAAFVVAPNSRFGDWLDRFVPRLREPATALATAVVFWTVAFALTLLR